MSIEQHRQLRQRSGLKLRYRSVRQQIVLLGNSEHARPAFQIHMIGKRPRFFGSITPVLRVINY